MVLDLANFSATKVTSGRGVVRVPLEEDSALEGLEVGGVVDTIKEEEVLDVFITKLFIALNAQYLSVEHFLKCLNKVWRLKLEL